MWLERFSGQSSQSTPTASPNRAFSPAPGLARKSTQLGPSTLPRRPGLQPRTSSLSAASFGESTESLPATARIVNGTNLRHELGGSRAANVRNPLEILQNILGPSAQVRDDSSTQLAGEVEKPSVLVDDLDFGGLSLEQFANDTPVADVTEDESNGYQIPVLEDFEKEKNRFDDLHKSILACDEVLKSVETYLTSFRADLAAVSSEIEHLQDRSTALNNKLQNLSLIHI